MTVRTVDLFAGAGGLSKGCEAAGATIALAVEGRHCAAETYRANHPGTVVIEETIDGEFDLRDHLKESLDDPGCDLLVGGPPCQGWSSLGPRGSERRRAELNACIGHFLAQVKLLQPPAVLIENVRGLATRDGGKHVDKIVRTLEEFGYDAAWHDVRAVDYGLPQLRHRVFVIATARDLEITYELPSKCADDPVTVWDAIGDLPSIKAGERSDQYAAPSATPYQKEMRGLTRKLTWHEAPNHSPQILKVLSALRGEGASRSALGPEVHLSSGFHNTYCRLDSRLPAPAVTSSAGRVSSGRNAHPFDDRALTPREAARLQGFPDSYVWKGDRWPVYEQIGNAVPPPLARHVAAPLIAALESIL